MEKGKQERRGSTWLCWGWYTMASKEGYEILKHKVVA